MRRNNDRCQRGQRGYRRDLCAAVFLFRIVCPAIGVIRLPATYDPNNKHNDLDRNDAGKENNQPQQRNFLLRHSPGESDSAVRSIVPHIILRVAKRDRDRIQSCFRRSVPGDIHHIGIEPVRNILEQPAIGNPLAVRRRRLLDCEFADRPGQGHGGTAVRPDIITVLERDRDRILTRVRRFHGSNSVNDRHGRFACDLHCEGIEADHTVCLFRSVIDRGIIFQRRKRRACETRDREGNRIGLCAGIVHRFRNECLHPISACIHGS